MRSLYHVKDVNNRLAIKAAEMLKYAKDTENIENEALLISKKFEESTTKSFVAKSKMIEVFNILFKICLNNFQWNKILILLKISVEW